MDGPEDTCPGAVMPVELVAWMLCMRNLVRFVPGAIQQAFEHNVCSNCGAYFRGFEVLAWQTRTAWPLEQWFGMSIWLR